MKRKWMLIFVSLDTRGILVVFHHFKPFVEFIKTYSTADLFYLSNMKRPLPIPSVRTPCVCVCVCVVECKSRKETTRTHVVG